jgi:alkylation response protein AidB-like acyl-CoA dehydrogenase
MLIWRLILLEARQILGGMGITGEYSIMRHMMNLESVITYEGTHDIHLLITGMDIMESQRLSSNKQLLKYI